MRLTLITPTLLGGGAERAAVLLAEGFLKKGHQVFVITLSGTETDFYQLSEGIHRLALNLIGKSPTIFHALWSNVYRLWKLRQTIQSTQPDAVISFMERTNILTLLATRKTKYLVIANEQCDPKMLSIGRMWEKLRRMTYPCADKVVSASQGVNSYFSWLPKTKREVIYNPLTPIKDDENVVGLIQGADIKKNWITAMGRLTYQKGFDMLLVAFKEVTDKHPDWQLIILGEGELRAEIETLREKLNLTHQVLFPGLISNPFPILKNSKLFVLSSRFEGFGNVLIEAMACGIPVISTDCPSGPREIIRDGINGILVPNEDVSALAAAMEQLISDEEERKRLAERAPEVKERFSLEKIVGTWETLINELIGEKQK